MSGVPCHRSSTSSRVFKLRATSARGGRTGLRVSSRAPEPAGGEGDALHPGSIAAPAAGHDALVSAVGGGDGPGDQVSPRRRPGLPAYRTDVGRVDVSPAATIAPASAGAPTAPLEDDPILDIQRGSAISVEDFADAMDDGIDRPARRSQRFAVAG